MANHASSSRHSANQLDDDHEPDPSPALSFSNLDPSLHTLHSLHHDPDDNSRLNEFAQQALLHNEDPSFALQGDIVPLSGLLEAASRDQQEEVDDDQEEFRVEDVEQGLNLDMAQTPEAPPSPRRRAAKRQRVADDHPTTLRLRKDAHVRIFALHAIQC
jgi:hypothetical protein